MVSKGRYVVGFAGDDVSFRGKTVVVNDFVLDGLNRTLQIRTAGYSGGNVGDLIFLGVRYGKSVAFAEITNIRHDRTLLVKEPQHIFWGSEFITDLKKPGQKLIVRFVTPPVRRLSIELSLGLSGSDLATDAVPVDTVILNIDSNGDNTITVPEAKAFVEQAETLIKGPEGLRLEDLAKSIPLGLSVTRVGLSGTGGIEEAKTMFNGLAARVDVVDGTPTFYFPWFADATPGVRVTKLGDVDQVDFGDFMTETRDEIIEITGNLPYDPPAQEQPWNTSSLHIDIVDKVRETMVVNGGNIKSIKRVKKCGKCYYKLEIEDSGFIPTMHPGKYRDCLVYFSWSSPVYC
jgi:hypothetical protein